MERLDRFEVRTQPLLADEPRGRDWILAVGLGVVGLVLAILVLSHRWPTIWSPPRTGGPEHDYNLRLLKGMVLLEGLGLTALGALVAWQGARLTRAVRSTALEAHAVLGLLLLAISHAMALLFYLPPQQLSSAEPVHTGAHLAHFYRIFAAHRLLSEGGHLWGFDPFFLAGYPAGWLFDLDTRGDTLFASALPFLSLVFATKIYILVVHGLVPFAAYSAARILGSQRSEALLAALLVVLYWHWGRPTLGTLRWAGMHSFLLACELVLLGLACAARFRDPDHRVRMGCLIGWTAIAIAVGCVQPMGLLLLAVGSGLAFAFGVSTWRRRDGIAVLAAVAAAGLLHGAWIVPLRRLLEFAPPREPVPQLRGAGDLFELFARPGAALAIAILVLGAAGLALSRDSLLRLPVVLGGTVTAWFAVAACGTDLGPLSNLEWARSVVPAILLAALPAGVALRAGLEAFARRAGTTPALVALLLAATLPPFLAVLDTRFFDVHRLRATLHDGVAELFAAIEAAAPDEGRLLFESTAHAQTALSDGFPLEALLPIHTRRAVLGAPQAGMPFADRRLEFGSGALGGRSLARWSAADFAAFLDRYAVGAVVAWSPGARLFLAAQSGSLESMGVVHGFALYRRSATPRFVQEGEAVVRAGYDRIDVSEMRGDRVVLAFHWGPGWRATSPALLERAAVPDDRGGFIGVRPAGIQRLLLRPAR